MNKFILRIALLSLMTAPVLAADNSANSLADLLNKIDGYQQTENRQNKAREAAFKQDVAKQQQLLAEAQAELKRQQQIAKDLKQQFDNNEKLLTEREEDLRLQTGNLGEMFGVVRQVAGDLNVYLADSLTIVEHPNRKADLAKLSGTKELPNIKELEALWYTLQHEMTINGQIHQFDAKVLNPKGENETQTITRLGVFNAISDQGYLVYDADLKQLQQLGKQPDVAKLARQYLASTNDMATFALDPSRGALLTMSLDTPDLKERIQQGALVGYIILVLGAIGLIVAAWRLVALERTAKAVRKQMATPTNPSDDNPLGRVLLSYRALSKPVNMDVLEAKMDEAVLKELPALESGQTLLKLIAGIAPLLGLLGTVTGMIVTFQAITNFGTGDPKLMAGGISQALVTTVEGLVVAIPLLLAHNWVASRAKTIMQILDEQSAGLIAEALEQGEE